MNTDYIGIDKCNLIITDIPPEYFTIEKLLIKSKIQLEKIDELIKNPTTTVEEYKILSYISLIESKEEYTKKVIQDRKLAKFINREIKIKICFPDLKTTKFIKFREFDKLKDVYSYLDKTHSQLWGNQPFQIGNQKKLYSFNDMNLFLIDAELCPANIFIKV